MDISDGVTEGKEYSFNEINRSYRYGRPFENSQGELIIASFVDVAGHMDVGNNIYWIKDYNQEPTRFNFPNGQVNGDVYDLKVWNQQDENIWMMGTYFPSENKSGIKRRNIFSAMYNTDSVKITYFNPVITESKR